uniref:Mating-type pheromone BAP1(3) n=1 Tax=Schizophyllum commune TaxID=5334 RepID=BAP13_SCHCO|nr:RecName: Full=Mating-type pheromone BAP1(3); Flags: Precursor [Schizophyllum commune]AAC49156.1 mating-type pheromone [Schizophyllum commune]
MDDFAEFFPTLVLDEPEVARRPARDAEVLAILADAERPGGSNCTAWCVVA